MKHIGIYLLWILILSSGTAWAEMQFIAHKDAPETTLSQKDIQEIFLGKRAQWQDNSAIHPVTVQDEELHNAFLAQYIKKTESKWNAYWRRLVFTGTGTPPPQFETEQELVQYVVKTKGAIGYVDAETPVENVAIIKIK
jgi:ABC-type phosphate transport system substrate-binding protein